MRFLLRLGIEPDRIEIDEFAVELRFLLRPQRLHREHALAQELEARVVTRAMILHFLDVPAPADGEHEASAGELIEASYRLRGDDRVALRKERNAGAEFEITGRCGCE